MNRDLHFTSIAFRSEIGLHREGNEDSGLAAANLIAVADGMGGYAGGEVASRTVIKVLAEFIPILNSEDVDGDSRDDLMRSSLIDMDSAIRAVAKARPELDGMGTTLTSLALFGDQITLMHIGDSRAYRIRDKRIARLSQDHTVVQELLDQGRISADEISEHPQRSFLTQALMGKEDIEPVLQVFNVVAGDIYLVCSDGLTAVVGEGEIAKSFENGVVDAISILVDLTYKNGAPDNVTIIAAQVGSTKSSLETTFIGAAR
jgi:serine/threonine protein phosphatase PrpC